MAIITEKINSSSKEDKESMLNKWDYSGVDMVCYSDEVGESYKKSADFLGDEVEDWGCGTCWSKQFFKNYRGIDGSPSKHIPKENVVDLVYYTSEVDNILMRQVLELNTEWKKILENVKKSFKKKFCLVVFTPFANETHVGEVSESGISCIYFNKQDILDYFPKTEFKINEELIKNKQGYGQDWILYVERII